MWDRLLVDCRIATMEPAPGNPLGIVESGAIAIDDGRIVRVGKRTELAGFRAKEVVALGGDWVTPGLVDCHTHLIFGGTRADEHAMRRAGATYEQIAKAGVGIASTVKATKAASDDRLLASAAMRLEALMRGGVTTVEIKSGYALDVEGELRILRCAAALAASESVRVVPTLLALHALPNRRTAGKTMSRWWPSSSSPAPRANALRPASTRFAKASRSRRQRSSASSPLRMPTVSPCASTPSNCPTRTVPHLPHATRR